MKKAITVLLAACLLLTALASCQKAEEESYDLTIVGKSVDMDNIYMTRIFDLFEEKTGKKIKLITFEDSAFEDSSAKLFEKGEVPDIFVHFHNADLDRFNVEENFLYLNDQEWVEDLTDGALAYSVDRDGNLLGLPFWESSVSGCYYNKKILDKYGLRPASNQSEFNLLCEILEESGCTPICWPANGCAWMLQFALDPVFADDPDLLEKLNAGQIRYADIPEVTDAVRWIYEAAQKGWFGDAYLETGWDGISPALSSGDAVMTFIWDTWFDTDFKDGKYSAGDFALMPAFLNTARDGTYEGGNLNLMMVNKNSPNCQTALEFLSFCADPENYNIAFAGISTVSVFKGQTTNIQSKMVTDAADSIARYGRVSTASTRIVGYNGDAVANAIYALLSGRVDVAGCVEQLDRDRLANAG